jgi:hypothetical protein
VTNDHDNAHPEMSVPSARHAPPPARRAPDHVAAALAGGFVLLLLGTELALSLPDENAPTASVAQFYSDHRVTVVVLQVLGLVAASLLGGYAWRLRRVDRAVCGAGLVMALCAAVPGLITLTLAIVADPGHARTAGRLNALEPRGDDLLFVGILIFAATVAIRLGPRLRLLGLLAISVAASSLARLVLEVTGRRRGILEAVGPLSFVVLMVAMAILSQSGALRSTNPTGQAASGPPL